MRILAPVLMLALFNACQSSAPYTLPAALINTSAALGLSAQQRSQGGCFAMCTNGTTCNPRTGFCEPISLLNVNEKGEGDGTRRIPTTSVNERQFYPQPSPDFRPTLGISPAPAMPPPAEASPHKP